MPVEMKFLTLFKVDLGHQSTANLIANGNSTWILVAIIFSITFCGQLTQYVQKYDPIQGLLAAGIDLLKNKLNPSLVSRLPIIIGSPMNGSPNYIIPIHDSTYI